MSRASKSLWTFEQGTWTPATLRTRAKKVLKNSFKRPLQVLGYDIRRYSQPPWVYDPWEAQRHLLQHIDQPVIFDAGANVGQTLEHYARTIHGAKIHSFEPFPSSFQHLAFTAGANPPAATHHVALGEADGEAILHPESCPEAVWELAEPTGVAGDLSLPGTRREGAE